MLWFITYFLAGSIVGILAGMLGIGGGMTLVPVLATMFAMQQVSPDHVVHLALGTAMASIIFTSGSSVREHYKLGSVDLEIVWRIAPGMVAGSLLSTLAVGWITQQYLALVFATIVYAGATQMLLNRKPSASRSLPGPLSLLAVAIVIGIICGLVSAGGAFLNVPFLLWCGIPLRTAIGTAAAIGIPVAIVGTTGYIISGRTVQGLPPDAFGFVSLIALAGLVCGSIVTAPMGARLAHRLPVLTLRRIFALLLYGLATRMIVSYA